MKYLALAITTVVPMAIGAEAPLAISLAAGKRQYVEREPIYLALVRENLAGTENLKSTSLNFCVQEKEKEECVPGSSFGEFSGLGIPGSGEALRTFVAIGTWRLERLFKKVPGEYRIFVKESIARQGKTHHVASNQIVVSIMKMSKEDSIYWNELSQIGNLELSDGIKRSIFGDKVRTDGFKPYENVIEISNKHSKSAFYPYVMSYVSDFYTPVMEEGKSEGSLSQLKNHMYKDKSLYSKSDPFLYVNHLIRNARSVDSEKEEASPQSPSQTSISSQCRRELLELKQEGKLLKRTTASGKPIKNQIMDDILDQSGQNSRIESLFEKTKENIKKLK